jgi:type IV fimbrial biogenesis protein FimT
MPVTLRQRGFTLIELMIGLVVLGILVMAAVPSYTAWIHNSKIRTTAEAVLNGIQLARAEAVRRNTNVTFVLGAGPTSDWTVTALYPAPVAPEVIQTRAAAQGSANVTVVAVPANSTAITFNSLGRVLAANAAPNPAAPFTSLAFDVPVTILPANVSRNLSITVSAGGNIRMCDPTVTAANDSRLCF